MKSKRILLVVAALVCAVFASTVIQAQTSSVFTTGLTVPSKIIPTGGRNFLVAEVGTAAPNSGRISLVDGRTGARRTLIEGMPGAVSLTENSPSGLSGLKLAGRKLYVTVGEGDVVMPGRRGGTVANPNPSSPLLDSVLEITLNADYEENTSGFTLSLANQTAIKSGQTVTLTNSEARQITVRLLADLPDFVVEVPAETPPRVRASNLYGLEIAGNDLYVVDAGLNSLWRINLTNGQFQNFVNFAPKPNPLTFGPPVSEAVPDSIRLFGNRLLVTYLTGFPFAPGLAEVRGVNIQTSAQATFIGGLTSAIDVLPVPVPGDNDLFYVLEFSSNMLAQPSVPGRLKFYTSPTATPVILNGNLITPTSMARDPETGDIFITELGPGRITRILAVETSADSEREN